MILSLDSNLLTWVHDFSVHLFSIWTSDIKFSLSAIDKWGNIAFKFHCYNYQQIWDITLIFVSIQTYKFGFMICPFIYLPMKVGFALPWFNSHF
jgi:hypothetical protein